MNIRDYLHLTLCKLSPGLRHKHFYISNSISNIDTDLFCHATSKAIDLIEEFSFSEYQLLTERVNIICLQKQPLILRVNPKNKVMTIKLDESVFKKDQKWIEIYVCMLLYIHILKINSDGNIYNKIEEMSNFLIKTGYCQYSTYFKDNIPEEWLI